MEHTTPTTSDRASHYAVVIGLLILSLALIFIGLYVWLRIVTTTPEVTPLVTRPTREENNEPESTTAEAQADTLEVVSTSDDLSAIEADLSATDLTNIDAELSAIDAELSTEEEVDYSVQ